jgi:hypothetical protein
MFAYRHLVLVLAAVTLLALAIARPSGSSTTEQPYVVRAGDTLWELASDRYAGDPREGVWRIRERNGLEGDVLPTGTVLYLPAGAGG